MALLCNVKTDAGVNINNCYVVVECYKSKIKYDGARIEARAYASQAYREKNIPIPDVLFVHVIKKSDAEYDRFEEDFLKENGLTDTESAYFFVKNLPESIETQINFITAEDC